jgi:hypothetical protein
MHEQDDNNRWFRNAEIQAALLTASLCRDFSEACHLIWEKRAQRAARAMEFRYPQIRRPDNHRRRYRQARREVYEREKRGIRARWALV